MDFLEMFTAPNGATVEVWDSKIKFHFAYVRLTRSTGFISTLMRIETHDEVNSLLTFEDERFTIIRNRWEAKIPKIPITRSGKAPKMKMRQMLQTDKSKMGLEKYFDLQMTYIKNREDTIRHQDSKGIDSLTREDNFPLTYAAFQGTHASSAPPCAASAPCLPFIEIPLCPLI
ncbi:MAG: hypothetical protein LUE27_01860 [Clostridia bacterium]|nr:hypothetical protein [Clostridia bacterium]